MSNPAFRIGLAGLSRSHARYLLPALIRLDSSDAAMVAVSDADAGSAQAQLVALDTAAARQAARKAGYVIAPDFDPDAVALYDDADAMIQDEHLDAVVIAGADRPGPLADRALQHGLHVLLVARPALADHEGLVYLSDYARGAGRVFWPAHPAGLGRPSAAHIGLREMLGAITGIRLTLDLARSDRREPKEAAELLWLTSPLARLLDFRMTRYADAAVLGHGPERTIRVIWDSGHKYKIEAEIRLGWTLGNEDRARITLHGATGAQADLPVRVPGTATGLDRRTLRGVLWHPEQGPIPLPPPLPLAAAHQKLVTEWLTACQTRKPELAPVATAKAAARFAADLATVLRQDG